MKLTKRAIDRLMPSDKDYTKWDDELKGFGVRVWPSGSKIYQVRYRQSGRQRFYKIGAHGPLTVEQARKQAIVVLGNVARREDPQEEKVTRRRSMTVAELCEEYQSAAAKGLIFGKAGRPKKPLLWTRTTGVSSGTSSRSWDVSWWLI